MDKYNEYTSKYPIFYYHGFNIVDNETEVFITYDFEVGGLQRFNPTLTVPKNKSVIYDKETLNMIVFSLGLAEIPSYWKCTCSPTIVIECGNLNNKQINWLKKLMYNGLGEFFYRNGITVNQDSFVNIKCTGSNYEVKSQDNYSGYLIAVGGGKDSIVSLEILKGITNKKAFIINNRRICFESCYTACLSDDDIINAERLFDRKIIDINNMGFLNGHTPISSCIAFISYLACYLNGIKYSVLSNESSANESSVKGTNINHQYSKSLEFENDFRWYISNYLDKNIEYFSLLRPLNELEIMKLFTSYPKYFKHFISCNNGGKAKNIGKTDGWCCSCSKCLFIYLIMSNFVNQNTMIDIFGENLLDKKELLDYFLELLGLKEYKPFECVGTIDEVRYVVNNLIKNIDDLPYLLRYYKDNYDNMNINDNVISNIDTNNNVPKELLELVLKELNNDR